MGRWLDAARLLLALAGLPTLATLSASAEAAGRPKVIIMTDIGQDPDDQQSLVRTLLYANSIDIRGLIATYIPRDRPVQPGLINAVIDAYGRDLPFLRQHSGSYPSAEALRAVVRAGLDDNGRIGDGYDTPGSDLIVAEVDAASNSSPVWVLAWGGSRELAQAVHKVRTTRTGSQLGAFLAKLKVYTIGWSQYSAEPARYLETYAKKLFWIASEEHDGSRTGTFRGMYLTGDRSMQDADWCKANINAWGALGAMYPLNTTEKAMKEGDTPSLLHLLPIGLNDPLRPEQGGWGGRYVKEGYHGMSAMFTSDDELDELGGTADRRHSVARWRLAFQSDLAARMRWTETSYANANHPPNASLVGASRRTVASGGQLTLDARTSSDPDRDALRYRWWIYEEAGTPGVVGTFSSSTAALTTLTAPSVSRTSTMHVILEVTDSGTPALTRYRRAIVTVTP